ncbi:unnamed protein product [Rotaria socialis]|uniref:Cytochrome P450 n=1 Tax=Rotaria socialis TaxID=392032 RepID=A0A821PW07_9BILA|nr:unnamed protein product [Rotaria socialis]CAF4813755.1 unnamed protein product [Rotaria socialis]
MNVLQSITPLNSVLIALALIIITLFSLMIKNNNKSRPPGPWGLPIIGYLPWLTDAPHLDFNNLSKKYGNVFRIHLMGRDFYIFNNYDVIKQAFVNQKDNFIRRPTEFSFFFWTMGYNAIGSTNGDNWKMHRKFLLKSLTTLGLGKVELELRMHEVLRTLLTYMEKINGQPHDYTDIVLNCTYNLVGLLMINRTYDMHNTDYLKLKSSVQDMSLATPGYDNFMYGPWFRL